METYTAPLLIKRFLFCLYNCKGKNQECYYFKLFSNKCDMEIIPFPKNECGIIFVVFQDETWTEYTWRQLLHIIEKVNLASGTCCASFYPLPIWSGSWCVNLCALYPSLSWLREVELSQRKHQQEIRVRGGRGIK